MSDENKTDQISQSGGITANVKGDLSAGQDVVGRDSIVSTTTTTTNVFNSDRLVTRGLVLLLAVVILVVVGLVVKVGSTPSTALVSPTQIAQPSSTLSPTLVPTAFPMVTVLPLPVQLPDGPTVTILNSFGEKYQYTILSAQREPLPPDRYLLQLRIRFWNDARGGNTFGSDSFRLVVGDRILAPVNYLNEGAERDETVDGDVQFEIDDSLKDAVLKISPYNDPSLTRQLRLIFP
jgi:hypothetical protein